MLAVLAAIGLTQAVAARPVGAPLGGSTVTRDFVDTELSEVIRFLSQSMGRNGYLGPGIEGKLTVSLRSVPPVAALHEVLASFSPNLAYKLIGSNTLVVAEPECRLGSTHTDLHPHRTREVRHDFLLEKAPAARVISALQKQFPDAEFIPHPVKNGFYIFGSRSEVLAIKTIVPDLDVAPDPVDQTVRREFLPIKFGDLDEVRGLLETLVPDALIVSNPAQGMLMVEGTAATIDQVKELAAQLDQPLDKVLLECKLVRVTQEGVAQIPVDWTDEKIRANPQGAQLRFGRFRPVKTVTLVPFNPIRPAPLTTSRISLGNGKSGELLARDLAPGSEWTAIELELKTQATVLENGPRVHCEFHGKFNFLTSLRPNGPPNRRNLSFDGEIELKDGETAILDGLLPFQEAAGAVKELPWLADLPTMGTLFRNIEPDGAVYLMLTPNIMK